MAAKADSTIAYVYVIASDAGPLKIGWTGRPKARLASIQNGAHSALRFAFLGGAYRLPALNGTLTGV